MWGLLWMPFSANAQVTINSTTFPDDVFRDWVIAHVAGAEDGELTAAECNAVTIINCNNTSGIKKLTGIEYFPKLMQLQANNCNTIYSVDVTHNPDLIVLYLNNNNIKSIDVSQNPNLKYFQIDDNKFTSVDVTNNTKLGYFYARYNQLTSVDVTHCPDLINLYLNGNQIGSIDLSNNPNLKILYLAPQGVPVPYVDLTNNTNLTQLYSYSNTYWEGLEDLTELIVFHVSDVLNETLDFTSWPKLHSVQMQCKSRTTDLDFSNNPILNNLQLSSYRGSLDLTNNPIINQLNIQNNHLTSLDLSNHTVSFTAYNASQSFCKEPVDLGDGKMGVEVPADYDMAKISDVQVDGSAATASLVTSGGKTYLAFDDASLTGKVISFNYSTGYTVEESIAKYLPIEIFTYDLSDFSSVAINSSNFPDANFRTWITENIDGADDGILTAAELAAVESIGLGSLDKVEDMTGVSYFKNLLILSNSGGAKKIDDIVNLPKLTQLTLNNSETLTTFPMTPYLTILQMQHQALEFVKVPAQATSINFGYNPLIGLDLSEMEDGSYIYLTTTTAKKLLRTWDSGNKCAFEVPTGMKAANMTNVKLNNEDVTVDIETSGGKNYLVIDVPYASVTDAAILTYTYDTEYRYRTVTINCKVELFSTTNGLTIGSAGAGTMYLPYQAYVPSGLQAWYLKDVAENTAIMFAYPLGVGEANPVIPANTAVFLTGPAGNYIFEDAEAEGTVADITDNIMKGTNEVIDIEGEEPHTYLTLGLGKTTGRLGWWYYSGKTLNAHRCFVLAADMSASAKVNEIGGYDVVFGNWDDDNSGVTGIRDLSTDHRLDVTAPVYNLAGQRVKVGNSYKGIAIQNGKKYIVK